MAMRANTWNGMDQPARSLFYIYPFDIWSTATNNYHLTARHVRGIDNVAADCLSRIHDKGLSIIDGLNLCCSRESEVNEGGSSNDSLFHSIGLGPINIADAELAMGAISGFLLG